MDIKIGDDEEQLVNELAEDFYKSTQSVVLEDTEDFFKRDEIKIMGLKDDSATLPNGSRIQVVEERHKLTVEVRLRTGKERKYEIDTRTGSVMRDRQICEAEEIDQLLKMLHYMKKYCTYENSETTIIRLKGSDL